MINKKIIYKNETYKRINRKKAINLLKTSDNIIIYTLPCKANPNNIFIDGFFTIEIDKPYTDYIDAINTINEITFYNCNKELGLYLSYYIKD